MFAWSWHHLGIGVGPDGGPARKGKGTVMADKKITPKQPSGASAANSAAAGVTKTSAKKLGHKKLGHKKLGHKKLGHKKLGH